MVKISACTIVKNEAHNITRWLTGVQDIADEIVVVDTGSTDDTVALAQAGGARIEYFSWCNDFAAAKNFALSQVSGEWVIFLDADEVFTVESQKKIRSLVEKYHNNTSVAGLLCKLYNIDEDDKHIVPDSMYQIRLFRNVSYLRYVGSIHESLHNLQPKHSKTMQLVDLEILHTGYSKRIIKAKLQRNLDLIIARQQEHGIGDMDDFYLMDCYYGLERFSEAIAAAQRASKYPEPVSMEGKCFDVWISSLIKLNTAPKELGKVMEKAIAKHPDLAVFYLRYGLLLWEQQDYKNAEKQFLLGLEKLACGQDDDLNNEQDNVKKYLQMVYQRLGKIAKWKGNEFSAADYYLQALKIYPWNEEVLADFFAFIRKADIIEQIEILNNIYNIEADCEFLAKVLTKLGAGKTAVYYISKTNALEHIGLRENGNMISAAHAAAQRLDVLYKWGIIYSAEADIKVDNSIINTFLPREYTDAWRGATDYGEALTGTALRIHNVINRLYGYLTLAKESKKKKQAGLDFSSIIKQGVSLAESGETGKAIHLLLSEWKRCPGHEELSYSLAVLLQVAGRLDEARKILLSVLKPTAATRELWEELGHDEEYPLVSIMIPTYNRPKLFELTLQSAIAQTYSNVEIIVCDNSTNEDTAHLMEKYQHNLRVHYYRNKSAKCKEENFMPFEHLAKGSYLQWLMDDDILKPEKLTKMMSVFKQYPNVTLVTSLRDIIDENGESWGQWHELDIDEEYQVFPGEIIWSSTIKKWVNYIGEPSATLFRRKDLTNHYWRAESRGYKTISDVAMWLELVEKGDCAIFKDPLSSYRRHGGQEGQLMDVILLSRLEWFSLITDGYNRQPYRFSQQEYEAVLLRIYQESVNGIPGIEQASEEMVRKYNAGMLEIKNILNI